MRGGASRRAAAILRAMLVGAANTVPRTVRRVPVES